LPKNKWQKKNHESEHTNTGSGNSLVLIALCLLRHNILIPDLLLILQRHRMIYKMAISGDLARDSSFFLHHKFYSLDQFGKFFFSFVIPQRDDDDVGEMKTKQ
jgi:hypothetical protein